MLKRFNYNRKRIVYSTNGLQNYRNKTSHNVKEIVLNACVVCGNLFISERKEIAFNTNAGLHFDLTMPNEIAFLPDF